MGLSPFQGLARQRVMDGQKEGYIAYVIVAADFNNSALLRSCLTKCEGRFRITVLHVAYLFCVISRRVASFVKVMKREWCREGGRLGSCSMR